MRLLAALAIIILNLIVLVHVLRERDRARSGFFLILNAFSLILWGGGRLLYEILNEYPPVLALPMFGALIVPANLLYFAATRPRPIAPVWGQPWILFAVFAPSVFISASLDYVDTTQSLFGTRLEFFEGGGDSSLLSITYLYYAIFHLLTLSFLGARYLNAERGPERVLPKHLFAAVFGSLVFAGFFWLVTLQGNAGLMPSPSVVSVLIAQVSIFIVIRQEEIERPLYLRRWMYYLLLLLVFVLAGNVMLELFEYLVDRPLLMPRQEPFVMLSAVLFVLAIASLKGPQRWFDRMLFRRAAEYRKIVMETQRELRETRERLRRAERLSMLGELSARIAHEIKNPLGPIKGYTQMLRERVEGMDESPSREKMLSQLSVIAEEADTIDRKVHQLLDIARRPQPIREDLDLNLQVERTMNLLRLEAAAASPGGGLRVAIDGLLDEDLPLISADRDRVEEILYNIGRNALDACDGDGEVTFVTRQQLGPESRRGISIVVRDTGPGLSPLARERVFTPFFTEKEGGTGLGLTIVKGRVEEHGGTIGLFDVEPHGLEVRIWLPCEPASAEVHLPDVSGELPGH